MPRSTTADTSGELPSPPAAAPAASRAIYLDNHATTPTDPRVAAVVLRYMVDEYGNASSVDHAFGEAGAAAVDVAVEEVATLVGASHRAVTFVSGATEALNLALVGFTRARRAVFRRTGHGRLVRVGATPVEHPAVLDVLRHLVATREVSVRWLRVDRHGLLDLEAFAGACACGLDLACVMAANNEVGTLAPLAEAAAIARNAGVRFLSDATQAVGKIPLAAEEWGIDLLALSAHKFYGPKGIGALVAHPDVPLEPLFYGGGHQRGLRSGTLPVPLIAGLGEAARLRRLEMCSDEARIASMRDALEEQLTRGIQGLTVNGSPAHRLAGNLHVSVPDVPSSVIIAHLGGRVAVARGSACASSIDAPSHVLQALGLPDDVVRGALRIGVGKFNTLGEVQVAGELLTTAVHRARAATSA